MRPRFFSAFASAWAAAFGVGPPAAANVSSQMPQYSSGSHLKATFWLFPASLRQFLRWLSSAFGWSFSLRWMYAWSVWNFASCMPSGSALYSRMSCASS